MNGRVGRVLELLCKIGVRGAGGDPLGLGNRAAHSFGAGSQHQLRAVAAQQQAALDRHGFRHGQDAAVAFGRADKCQADAGVAGSRLDNHRIGI